MPEITCDYEYGRLKYYKLNSSGTLTPDQNLYSQSPFHEYIQLFKSIYNSDEEVIKAAISKLASGIYASEDEYPSIGWRQIVKAFKTYAYPSLRDEICKKGGKHSKPKLNPLQVDEIFNDLARFPHLLEYTGQLLENERYRLNGTPSRILTQAPLDGYAPSLTYSDWVWKNFDGLGGAVIRNGSVHIQLCDSNI